MASIHQRISAFHGWHAYMKFAIKVDRFTGVLRRSGIAGDKAGKAFRELSTSLRLLSGEFNGQNKRIKHILIKT